MTKKGKRKRQRLRSVARHQSGQQEIERKCPDQISEDNDSDDDHTNNNEELLEGDGHGKCLRKKKKKRKKKKRRMESSTATLNNCNVTLPSKETKLCSPPDIFTGNEHKIAPAAAASKLLSSLYVLFDVRKVSQACIEADWFICSTDLCRSNIVQYYLKNVFYVVCGLKWSRHGKHSTERRV